MRYQNILVTGGCGFIGSNIAVKLKEEFSGVNVIVLDNLKRRGSELNLERLQKHGISFRHGDIRNEEDLKFEKDIDLIIECSAEPSVLAGFDNPLYVIRTNLLGTVNCLELARGKKSDFIFLSTSRVYPLKEINQLAYRETSTRFALNKNQKIVGASDKGISENFPLGKERTFYGATKLASEFLVQEYVLAYGLNAVINRCGIIAGPWQFGKVDQGVIAFWLKQHISGGNGLAYIGYNGTGKQVRDCLHIEDLWSAVKTQISNLKKFNQQIFNIGGGAENSFSLLELTSLCEGVAGRKIKIKSIKEERPGDIRIYLTDYRKFSRLTGWKPQKNLGAILNDTYHWIKAI